MIAMLWPNSRYVGYAVLIFTCRSCMTRILAVMWHANVGRLRINMEFSSIIILACFHTSVNDMLMYSTVGSAPFSRNCWCLHVYIRYTCVKWTNSLPVHGCGVSDWCFELPSGDTTAATNSGDSNLHQNAGVSRRSWNAMAFFENLNGVLKNQWFFETPV
jgi:hypothetical protein